VRGGEVMIFDDEYGLDAFKVIYRSKGDPMYCLEGKEYVALGYSHGLIRIINESGEEYLCSPEDFEIVLEDIDEASETTKRVIVCGSRKFNDKELLYNTLDDVVDEYGDIEIISGHAQGADRLAEAYAEDRELKLRIFPAAWKQFGKAAGPIRNRAMLKYAMQAYPLVVAFWDGSSRGTKNMISLASSYGIDVWDANMETKEVMIMKTTL